MISAQAHEDGAFPVSGTVVLAGRPLRPGTDPQRLSRFGDSRWDLSPAVFEEHMPAVSMGFDTVPPEFLHAAKTYIWILLNTDCPVPLRRSGGTARLSCLTVAGLRGRLFPFFSFLASRQVGLLSQVSEQDYDAYLAWIREAQIPLHQREDLVTEVRRLWSYRAQMPAGHSLPDTPPWDGDDTQHLVGARPASTENTTRRIPEDTIRALLLWAIRYVDEFAPDILAAWHEYLTLARRNPGRRKGRPAGDRRQSGDLAGEIPGYLDQLRTRGDGLPGKNDADGSLRIDWAHLCRVLDCGNNNFASGMISRRLIDASGLPLDDGAPLAAPVTAQLDGGPWLPRRIRYLEAEPHARRLSTACLIVITYLSGMRIGEVLSLARGCVTCDQQAGLWLVYGTAWKTARDSDGSKLPQGVRRDDPWVVIPVVARAIAVLERLHDSRLLFPCLLDEGRYPTTTRAGTGRLPAHINRDLNDFKQHVNHYCATRGRNDPIPDENDRKPLSGSRFRRTLAWHICRRPRGLVAGAIQYGQLRTQIFLGYAGNYASGFRDEAAMEEFLARLEELADAAARLDAGEHVSGPAAATYTDRIRASQAQFAGRIIQSGQASRAILANPSLQIFQGHGMTCAFDARKALCQTHADDTRRTPALDDCRLNCGNIARTDRDITVLNADIARLAQITADPLSPPIRHRRETGRLRELQQITCHHEHTRPQQAQEEPSGG